MLLWLTLMMSDLIQLPCGIAGLQMVHKHRPDLLEGDLAVLLPAVPLQASIQAGRMSKERMIQSRCRTAGSQEPLPLWK